MSKLGEITQKSLNIYTGTGKDFEVLNHFETSDKIFSIIDNLGYEEIKEKLSQSGNGYSFEDVLVELGDEKSSIFFYWFILYSDADLENKKYFLSKAIDLEYNETFSKLFSRKQLKEFAYFVVNNNLVDGIYSTGRQYLESLGEDLFQEKYAHLFIYIYRLNLEQYDHKNLINFIFDNFEIIYKTLKKIENSEEYEYVNEFSKEKNNFDAIMFDIIKDNTKYFLEKINSLEYNDFVFVTQNLLCEAINNFLTLKKIKEILESGDTELKTELQTFIDRLGGLGLANIKLNFTMEDSDYGEYKTDNKENNYFNVLLEHKRDKFEELDINDISSKNIDLPNSIFENENFNKIFIKKFLEITSINYGDLTQDPGLVVNSENMIKEQASIFLDAEILNHVGKNFSEHEKLNFIIFLNNRTNLYFTFSHEKNVFLQKVIENEEIRNIFGNSKIVDFISLFRDEFLDFNSVINSNQIKLFLELGYGELEKINTILEFFKKVKNIKFQIKLKDINKEFLNFILNNFYFDLHFIKDGILKYNLRKLNNFFDVEVNNLDFFTNQDLSKNSNQEISSDNGKEENRGFQIQNSFGNSKLISNLKKICKIYNIEFKLSNLIEIEKKFNEFLGEDISNNIYLLSFLGESDLDKIDSIFSYFKKYHSKSLNINELLLVLTEITKIDLSFVGYLDKNVSDFDAKDLIKINGNKVELGDLKYVYDLFNKCIGDVYIQIDYLFDLFHGFTKEKLFNLVEELSNFKRWKDALSFGANPNLEHILGEYSKIENINELESRNRVFLIRHLIQKAIEKNIFFNLEEQIEVFFTNHNYSFHVEVSSYQKLENIVDRLLNTTNGFLNETIIKQFVFYEALQDVNYYELSEAKENFEKITGIDFDVEDFKDEDFLDFLYNEGIGYLTKGNKNIGDFEYFFQKFPDSNGKKWEKEDFKEGGILNNILKNVELSVSLIKRLNYNIEDLIKLYKSPILDHLGGYYIKHILDGILSYNKGFYYGYIKHILKINNGSFLEQFVEMLESEYSDVNLENFTDFMDDGEVLFEFEQDKNTKFNGFKPWTKEWFLDKPERKKYLNKDYLIQIQKKGTLEFLYFQEKKINFMTDNNFEELSNILGFKIGLKNYIYMKNVLRKLQDEKIDIGQTISKIDGLNKRNLELIGGYLEEIGVSYYYFVKDLLLLGTKITAKSIIELLKNRIYPTNNIIIFLEENNFDIQKLVNIKQNYRKNGGFDNNSFLHIDLEYIDFRYLIDKATEERKQFGKGYLEYRQLLNGNYDENLDDEKSYEQAGKESYYSYKFIQNILKENEHINVFPNFSYGKVLVAGFKKNVQNNSKINYKEVRIGSTECHEKISFLKKDLFSKGDIKNIFKGDSIILDGTTNKSFGDSNIGFKSYFYVLNKVLAELNNNSSFIEGYNKYFISSVESNEKYLELFTYLKDITQRNNLHKNAKKFEFLYVGNYEEPYLRTRYHSGKDLFEINDSKFTNKRYIFFTDFVERGNEYQAYFDDKHITDFKIITTENGLNFVDVNFEEKVRQYFMKFLRSNIESKVVISKESMGD